MTGNPDGAPLRIAFGAFPDWSGFIADALEPRFTPSFVELDVAPLDTFDAVVPLQLHHYPPLARRPDLRGRKFLHPSPQVVELCDDKLALNRFLIAEGFEGFIPPLRPPGPPYPYIWKQRQGYFGLHCRVIAGPEDEAGLDLTDEAWFAQALSLGAVEYATHLLRASGRLRYALTVTYQMAGGDLVRGGVQAPLDNAMARGSPCLDVFAAILERLDYEGVACFNYKLAGGRPMIFEINPRYGGSLTGDVNGFLDAYLAALDRS